VHLSKEDRMIWLYLAVALPGAFLVGIAQATSG
jgi:hypothetical protein